MCSKKGVFLAEMIEISEFIGPEPLFQFGVRGLVCLQHLQEIVSKSDNLSFLTV